MLPLRRRCYRCSKCGKCFTAMSRKQWIVSLCSSGQVIQDVRCYLVKKAKVRP